MKSYRLWLIIIAALLSLWFPYQFQFYYGYKVMFGCFALLGIFCYCFIGLIPKHFLDGLVVTCVLLVWLLVVQQTDNAGKLSFKSMAVEPKQEQKEITLAKVIENQKRLQNQINALDDRIDEITGKQGYNSLSSIYDKPSIESLQKKIDRLEMELMYKK